MNTTISMILLILIIIYIFLKIKKSSKDKDTLYNKEFKLIKKLFILSLITFIITLLINIYTYGKTRDINIITTYITNAFTVALIPMPLSLSTLYINHFKEKNNLYKIKAIISTDNDELYIKKFKQAGIDVLLDRKAILLNETTIESDNLKETYEKLLLSRHKLNNYTKALTYLFMTYIPLLLIYLILGFIKFPVKYNISFIILIKLITIYVSNYVIKTFKIEPDLNKRQPIENNKCISIQERCLILLNSIYILFMLLMPYMYIVEAGGFILLATSFFMTMFIFTNLFLIYALISDSPLIKNIIKNLRNPKLIIITILSIIITIVFYKTNLFNTINITIKNYISSILFSIVAMLFYELIKFARFTSIKGRKRK